jgi:hypothetical protein
LYEGLPTGKQGRPKQYAGKINVKKPDSSYFKIAYEDEEIRILSAIVYCVALKRNIKLALTQYLSKDEQVRTTKLFESRVKVAIILYFC